MTGDSEEPNYPDFLGYITGGERITIGNTIEVAVAVRPPVVVAGKPFMAVALIQNITDANVQVAVALQLPVRDAAKHSDRFFTRSTTTTVTLHPAEVGYVVLPINCDIKAAPSTDYRLSVEFHPRPVGKPRRIRYHTDTPVNLNYYFALTATVLQRIMKLKALNFSGVKRGLFGNRAVEASYDVRPGKEQKITRNTPTWVRLWAIGEHTDARPLLERYHEMLRYSIVPQLTLSNLYDPLFAVTQQRIWAAGYDVTETEVHYIVKLMTHVLEMSGDIDSPLGYPDEAQYRIARTIEQGWPTDGRPVPLPHWAKAMLSMIGFEEELVVGNPIAALAGPLYGDLMFDTITHGFNLVDTVNKLPFARHELEEYAAQIVDSLWDSHASLGMMEVYLPLVLGGILIDDRVFIRHEQKLDNLHAVHDIIGTYRDTDNTDVQAVVTLCEDIVHFMLRKYGFRWGRI